MLTAFILTFINITAMLATAIFSLLLTLSNPATALPLFMSVWTAMIIVRNESVQASLLAAFAGILGAMGNDIVTGLESAVYFIANKVYQGFVAMGNFAHKAWSFAQHKTENAFSNMKTPKSSENLMQAIGELSIGDSERTTSCNIFSSFFPKFLY